MHAKTCLSLTPPLSFSLEFVPPPQNSFTPTVGGVKAHRRAPSSTHLRTHAMGIRVGDLVTTSSAFVADCV